MTTAVSFQHVSRHFGSVRAVDEVSLRAAARRLASDLRYAQGQAISRRIRHGVRFELVDRASQAVLFPELAG